MGTAAAAQRVLLGEGGNHRRALFTDTHHRCLGSNHVLPYSAHRGKKSVNRQALDDLKQQIPLMGYLQAHDWHPARRLSRGRWMGLCPLHGDHKPSFLVGRSTGHRSFSMLPSLPKVKLFLKHYTRSRRPLNNQLLGRVFTNIKVKSRDVVAEAGTVEMFSGHLNSLKSWVLLLEVE
jgi:hypothetical protein